MTDKPAIGFIGLGLMGAAMVERLQSLDYPVTVLANRARGSVDAAVKRGAKEASSAKELAAASDIVMVCVPTSSAVETRMRGPEGVIAGLKKDTLVIDFGTSLPSSTLTMGEAVADAGATYIDAPLGRTPAHAKDGKLNIMVGGTKEEYARAEPLLRDLGENVFHVGPLGTGHTLKLINNFFGMTIACAMAEAFAIASRAGVKRQLLYDVLSAGPNHSGMVDFVAANALEGVPDKLAFSVANAHKDLSYYTAMADALSAPSLIGSSTKQTLALAKSSGHGSDMVPELVQYFDGLFKER